MKKIYFWYKSAAKPESEDEDKFFFYEVEEEQSIRELVRVLDSKIIGNRINFSEIHPDNPSIKRWIKTIIREYPQHENYARDVEDLVNTYRSALQTKSKEKEKFVVGVLQLRDVLLLVHCKKDPSLAEVRDKLYSVRTVLHPKNILRADIIKNEDGVLTLGAFEYNRKFSKGHAEFWGLDPEDVGWESLGDILLTVELESFSFPLQILLNIEQLQEMFNENKISPMGRIKIGREEGKITKVNVYRKTMDFQSFYDFYITETKKLDNYKKTFNEIADAQKKILDYPETLGIQDKYRYEEDERYLYEITPEGKSRVIKKERPRYFVSFFTKTRPGISPSRPFVLKLYKAIFENTSIAVWHAGEDSSLEPLVIGRLEVYNKIELPDEILLFSKTLLNLIQDVESRKAKLLLQSCFCKILRENLISKHFKYLFDFLLELIHQELEYEFEKTDSFFHKEEAIEFKSASDYISCNKPKKFVEKKLVPTVKKYIEGENIKRYCILYGVEDNSKIQPIYSLKSDQISEMERLTNEKLGDLNIKVSIQSIPFKEGLILVVFIVPTCEGG